MGLFLLLLLLTGGVVAFFHRMFPPEDIDQSAPPVAAYDSAPFLEQVNADHVRVELERILAMGSRFPGQPGALALEQHLRERFAAAGLELFEQENRCAMPRTLERRILGPDGQPLAGTDIYPFLPNGLQPMNTPPGGLEGQLILVDDDEVETRHDFSDCIGLVDVTPDQVPERLGLLWSRYAKLGFKALVVSHPAGLESIDWYSVSGGGMVSTLPVNYVRLAATPEIFSHVGQRVTLHVRTEYADTRHTSLFGVLRAPGGSGKSAMVLSADFDACSPLPDLAPGAIQALGPAIQLAALDGLAVYRDQLKRDVVFAAFSGQVMSHDGKYNLLRLLGANAGDPADNRNPVLRALGVGERERAPGEVATPMILDNTEETAGNNLALAELAEIDAALAAEGIFRSPEATSAAVGSLGQGARDRFEEQVSYVLDALILELSEPVLQAKISFDRRGDNRVDSPEFKTYQDAKDRYEQAMTVGGLGLNRIVAEKQAFLERHGLVDRWRARFLVLREHHEQRRTQLAQDKALMNLFNGYREKLFVHPYLVPAVESQADAGELVSFLAGADTETEQKAFQELYVWAWQKSGLPASSVTVAPHAKDHERNTQPNVRGAPYRFVDQVALDAGYSMYAPINLQRGSAYEAFTSPVILPFMTNMRSLVHSLRLTGEVMLTLAMGTRPGEFKGRAGRMESDAASVNFGGRVLVSNVGQSVVPSFPLAGALVSGSRNPYYPVSSGYYNHPYYIADPYGCYDLPYQIFGFASQQGTTIYSPLAVAFGPDGNIQFMKDEGASGQRLFKSAGIVTWVADIMKNVTIVTFRAAPVSVLDLMNPQTMREYTGVEFIDRDGLSTMEKTCRFPAAGVQDGIQTTFVAPDEVFFIKLLSGTADNDFANETRAFMLGVDDAFIPDPDREIDGRGFLAQDNALISGVAFDTARSMAFLNGKRLALQQRHHMTDARTEDYHKKSLALARESGEASLPLVDAARKARESITYSTLNHPVLRESIFEAVLGILWYLGLLVPFVFFFEKLVFGYTDIRKQLAAQGGVFIVVFLLLNVLHPAFAMVRSSLMILLGFVIMLISGGVTLLSSGKFSENLEELRKKSGKVKAADINAMSAISSAFMLGLNNMHRRKLRTGLTCATLVLMTFVMICFTSVQSDLVDEQITLGKALYQGFLVKKERFRGMTGGEVYALDEEYGHLYDICPRNFLIGSMDWEKNYRNPAVPAVYQPSEGVTRRFEFQSILSFSDKDPVRDALRFTTRPAWFTEDECRDDGVPPPVFVSDVAAEELGLSPADIEAGLARIVIHAESYPVKGIFEAESLEQLQDLDGQDLLPFDIEALESVQMDESVWQVVADADDPRIPAGRVLLFPSGRVPDACQDFYSRLITASVAVSMPELTYPEAREEIDAYMERSARSVYYGLDGIAYRGKRTRETSLAGLLDMLIPLIIAALVVLNTIKGSVYERRDEIYVYNAVGIAPRYVFFMFFAEAIVYAVVGAVMGYLLSQGVGRVLTELGLTGGMNMTFTSLTTIYASLAIAAATFISTWFPARTAMEIATPAEDAGWRLPEPDGSTLRFDLPFTFTHRDRIAVLSFFERYLGDHGEGSAGRFFAGPPEVGVAEDPDTGACIPRITATIWLKPYDLSVSQRIIISLPVDEETREFKASVELERLSGTREAWLRLNHGFVAQVRRHFLHWRAVDEVDRAEMFVEARKLLEHCGQRREWAST